MTDKPQHPPTIDLDGARLRPFRVADADALYAYLRDPAVTERTSYPVASVPMVEAMIERSLSRWAAGELSKWGVVLQHDDQLVGTCGFNEWSQVHRWAELGFDLAQAHWGKGLMRQAVDAVLKKLSQYRRPALSLWSLRYQSRPQANWIRPRKFSSCLS